MAEAKKDLLVSIADGKYINQVKELFASVYFNSGWQGDYLLLTSGLKEEEAKWFKDKGIIVYDKPLMAEGPIGITAYPPIVLAKFHLFKEEFKKWRKIIFIDADVIVRASLDGLLQYDGFSACQAISFRLKDEFINHKRFSKIIGRKYCWRDKALATGMFVLDSNLITKDTFFEICSLYENFKDFFMYNEESTLNIFFYRNWHELPVVYNTIPGYLSGVYGIGKEKILAFILHFVRTKIGPWEKENQYFEEWTANRNRANEIDLANRPPASKLINDLELKKYLRYFKRKECLYQIRFFCRPFYFLDRQIGRLGLFVKARNYRLYEFLVRFKKL